MTPEEKYKAQWMRHALECPDFLDDKEVLFIASGTIEEKDLMLYVRKKFYGIK